MKKVFKKSE